MSFAVWLTGRPASGKSTIARALVEALDARGLPVALLESDVLRTQITPFARYDEAERELFYGALVALGEHLVRQGRAVVFDATANRRRYRDAARSRIGAFFEVHVDTPLETCRARDPKGLYRRADVAALPGVQVPYEPPLAPELVVDGASESPRAAAERIVERVGI